MINWKKYFDKIVCISFNQFKTRRNMMEKELKRVGILDSGIFNWETTYLGPFEKLFAQMIREQDIIQNKKFYTDGRISTMLGHLHAVKEAYYSGCERLLVIEDDERFLKDLNQVEKMLDNMPPSEEWDLILFDKFATSYSNYNKIIHNKEYIINDYYCKFISFLSAGCYCVNRKSMEILISLCDSGIDRIFDINFSSIHLNSYWKKICTIKPLCVQVMFSKAQSSTRHATDDADIKAKVLEYQQYYKHQEIQFDDYMMRQDGSSYFYGDYIEE